MKVTLHTGTKHHKLFPFTTIYTLNIYSNLPYLAQLLPAVTCTASNPPTLRVGIQESDFMKSDAKLNAKNPLRAAKKFMNFSSTKPPGLLDIFLYFFRKYVL